MSAMKATINWDQWEEQETAFDDSTYTPELGALYRTHALLIRRLADDQAGHRIAFRTVHDVAQLIFEIEAAR